MSQVPANIDIDRQLISEVAMDIGKELVAYIERMMPEMWAEMNSGNKLSLRNHVHNDIMSVLKCRTETDYRSWLDRRKRQRRELLKMVRAYREAV